MNASNAQLSRARSFASEFFRDFDPEDVERRCRDELLGAVLRRMGIPSKVATVHGFRSTFRDWTAERTAYAREVAEMALAHVIESATERAYRRGDLLEKRRRLMRDWAAFIDGPVGDVVGIRGAGS